jgi:hemoglobin-like flavoprotein
MSTFMKTSLKVTSDFYELLIKHQPSLIRCNKAKEQSIPQNNMLNFPIYKIFFIIMPFTKQYLFHSNILPKSISF